MQGNPKAAAAALTEGVRREPADLELQRELELEAPRTVDGIVTRASDGRGGPDLLHRPDAVDRGAEQQVDAALQLADTGLHHLFAPADQLVQHVEQLGVARRKDAHLVVFAARHHQRRVGRDADGDGQVRPRRLRRPRRP